MGQISDNRILVSSADSAAAFDDLAGGAAGALDTDVFIEGSASVGRIVSTSRVGNLFDAGSAQDWSDNIFYFWINCGIVPLLQTQNLRGFTIRFCGATVTNWFEVHVGGSDFWPKAVQGGWVQFVVDIEEARAIATSTQSPDQGTTNGTVPATSAIRYVGYSGITASVMPKHVDNTWIDAIYRLPRGNPGIIVSGDNSGDPYNWQDVLDAADFTDPTKAWGTAKSLDGVIFLNTPVQFGNAGSPNFSLHDFEDANVVMTWEEQEFVRDGFYGFTFVGDATSSTQRLVAGVNGSAGQGWTVLASQFAPRWFLDATDVNVDEVGLYGCSFTHTGIIDIDNVTVNMFDSLLIDGQRLYHSRAASPRSGADFRRNAIIQAVPIYGEGSPDAITSPANRAYMWTADPDKIIDCDFNFLDNHAQRIDASGPFTYSGNQYTGPWLNGTSPDGNQTFDAGILAIQGGLILNIAGGGDTPTVFDVGSPETVINNNISVTITNIQPGTEVRVYPVESPANLTEIAGIESTGSPSEFSFSAAAGLVVRVVVFNIDYVLPPDNEFELTIPNADTSFPITQIIDRNYLNP